MIGIVFASRKCQRGEKAEGKKRIHGVQGLFAPTVLAAPGENNPRKTVRIRAPFS